MVKPLYSTAGYGSRVICWPAVAVGHLVPERPRRVTLEQEDRALFQAVESAAPHASLTERRAKRSDGLCGRNDFDRPIDVWVIVHGRWIPAAVHDALLGSIGSLFHGQISQIASTRTPRDSPRKKVRITHSTILLLTVACRPCKSKSGSP